MPDFQKFQRQARHGRGALETFNQSDQVFRLVSCSLLFGIIQRQKNRGWNPQAYGQHD